MRLRLEKFSYRFAKQVFNSKLELKQEIENILTNPSIDINTLNRKNFNKVLKVKFIEKGWESQPRVFNTPKDPSAKLDFFKDRIGVEVQFGYSSFIGIDLLKFQVSSYSGLDIIDIRVYIVTTRNFQKIIEKKYGMK